MKKILLLVAAMALAIGALPGPKAEALVVQRYCSDYASYGNRICYDYGAGLIYVYDTATHVYAVATAMRPTADLLSDGVTPVPPPTSSYKVTPDSQCGTFGTVFNGYPVTFFEADSSGRDASIFYAPSTPTTYWAWYNGVSINTAFVSTVAWMANSNTGYECIATF